jgi:hypothetical protein
MPITIIILGFGLVIVGVFFAVGGFGHAQAGGSALKGISVEGPSWLILVALGVGTILFGAWRADVLPTTEAVTSTTVAFDDFAIVGDGVMFEPFTFGDDPELDELWVDCDLGDGAACDLLFDISPIGSEYEEFGLTCGFRFTFDDAPVCADTTLD